MIQAGLSLLTFFSTLLMARFCSEETLGNFNLIYSWISIVGIFSLFGLDDFSLKKVPYLNESEKKGFLSWGILCILISTPVSILLFLSIVLIFKISGVYDQLDLYYWALLVLPFQSILIFTQNFLKANNKIFAGQIVEKIFLPAFFIVLLILSFLTLDLKINIYQSIWLRNISFLLALILSIVLAFQSLDKNFKYRFRNFFESSILFFLVSTIIVTVQSKIDIILLGVFRVSLSEIAYYNVAARISDVLIIPYLAICSFAVPKFSQFYKSNDILRLKNYYIKVNLFSFWSVCLAFITIVFFGKIILSFFGDNFTQSYSILIWLSFAKLLMIFMGPATYLLNMTNAEKQVTFLLALTLIINFICQYLFIPVFGSLGAAYALVISFAIYALFLSILIFRKFKFIPHPFQFSKL